jgi:hypothetical protein
MRAKPDVSAERLGEDSSSQYSGDINHWVGVYSELLRLVDEAVGELGREHELSHTDLDGYRGLFEKRLAFWRERLRQHETVAMDTRQVENDWPVSTDPAASTIEP